MSSPNTPPAGSASGSHGLPAGAWSTRHHTTPHTPPPPPPTRLHHKQPGPGGGGPRFTPDNHTNSRDATTSGDTDGPSQMKPETLERHRRQRAGPGAAQPCDPSCPASATSMHAPPSCPARATHTGTAASPSRVCHHGVRGRSTVRQALGPDNRDSPSRVGTKASADHGPGRPAQALTQTKPNPPRLLLCGGSPQGVPR